MLRSVFIPLLLLLASLSASALAAEVAPAPEREAERQQAKKFEKQVTIAARLNYLLYLPKGYADDDKPWPLLLFLHGSGETGDDVAKVKIHGPPKLVEAGQDLPFIVVSPQTPIRTWMPEVVGALLDEVIREHRVDEDRIYVTGLSMGGAGTWNLAAAFPNRFAAIAPICGAGSPADAAKLKQLPIWAFHGAQDSPESLERHQAVVDAVKKAGNDVEFTVYPELKHDCWTVTYENPRLYEWLLSHRRTR